MVRHHTGNDLFFARMLPDCFAARYVAFHKDDVERLCEECHKNVHKLYKPLLNALFREAVEHGQRIITEDWCRGWMMKFRERFYKWVEQKPRKRRRRRKRRLGPKREDRKSA